VKTDNSYSAPLDSHGGNQPRYVGHCPIPVIDISRSGLNVEKITGGMTGPVVIHDGNRAVLVSYYPIELVAGAMPAECEVVNLTAEIGCRNMNQFIATGDYWAIRFNGIDLAPLKHEKGMIYIHRLLSNPFTTFTYHELRGPVSGTQEQTSVDMSNYWDESDDQIGSITRTPGTSVDATDQKMRDAIQKELKKLLTQREKCEDEFSRLSENLDPDTIKIEGIKILLDKNEKEIADLEKYVRKNSFGRKKIMDANEKNLRNKIQTAIKRCIESIATFCPELGVHLGKRITRHHGVVEYRPTVGVSWVTTR